MRILGVLGIIASVIIFVALLFLPAQVIPFATDVTTNIADGLRTISESMASTSSSLRSASDVLDTASTTIISISDTVKDTKPLLESAADVVGDVGENTLEKTNQALASAQSAAQAVDGVLRGLAFLPIGINYDPERSLGDSLADVADGLAPLPEGLIDISEKIQNTADGFDDISGGLDRTGSDIQDLSDNIRHLGERLGILSSSLEEQAETLDQLIERLPTIIWVSVILLELFVLSVVLAQVTVFVVGGRLYRENAPEA
jgi:methyl-accepting chemotaxis protein